MDAAQNSPVSEFLNKQTIFVTGITGFLGKVILAQLLRNCPTIPRIFVLIRGRKGKTAAERFKEEVLSQEIFHDILEANPAIRTKITVVEGDIVKAKLGISTEAETRITAEATVFIHCAATTKFTENLRVAIDMNVIGSMRVLELAKKCNSLCSYVHVSTAYVNCNQISERGEVIEEKIYPIRWDPQEVVAHILDMSPEQVEAESDKIISPYPNTYTFSKTIGEHLLAKERNSLPIAILRPSIIGCALRNPLPGWVDTLIGANGLLLAGGVGALHAMRGKSSNVVDFIPVDHVASGVLVVAWKTAQQYRAEPKRDIPIYHFASSAVNPVNWDWTRQIVGGFYKRHPPKRRIGNPWAWFIPHPKLHKIAHTLLHLFPAALADGKRVIQGKKPKLVNATRRLHVLINQLWFFVLNQWFFRSDNVAKLMLELNEVDAELYNMDIPSIEWEHYFIIYSAGIKRFLLKEEDTARSKL